MDERLKQEALKMVKIELFRRSFIHYAQETIPNFKRGKHLEYTAKLIQEFIEGKMEEDILVVSMPPQHGKSELITRTLPAWYISNNPTHRAVIISYGDDLAVGFGRRNKEKIEEFGKYFNVKLNRKVSADGHFEIYKHKGSITSVGIGAGITGKSAELIVIDDPIKNQTEADSETYRKRIWGEFLSSVNTRLQANGKVVIIQTRWHEDDLIGRLIENMPHRCKVVNIPLEAEEDDILGREVGDALFPEIGKDNAWLKRYKTGYTSEEGTRTWNALMQGRPTSLEGNLIKRDWWQYYEVDPRPVILSMGVDATFKDNETSDYVAVQVWGKRDEKMYLLDSVNRKMGFVETTRTIMDMKQKWGNVNFIYIEDKANGSAVIEVLRQKIPNIIGVNPLGNKISRANAVTGAIEAGNVYLPKREPFTHEFVNQCASFPNAKHDDMVDCMSMVLNKLMFMQASVIDYDNRSTLEIWQGKAVQVPALVTNDFANYGT